MFVLTQPLRVLQDLTQGQLYVEYSWFEFFFSKTGYLNKAQEPSLFKCLPIIAGRTDWWIPFARGSVWGEMQTVSSRIWTWIADLISYKNNRYAIWYARAALINEIFKHKIPHKS